MKVEELLPEVHLRVQFSLKARKSVPQQPGCYVLTTFDGQVLYIGLTKNLYRRFAAHRDSKGKRRATAQGSAFWFHYLPCKDNEVNRIERTWLNLHRDCHGIYPILNKVSSPVR